MSKIKFRYKILILCISVYVATLLFIGVVIENTIHNRLLNEEINNRIKEREALAFNISLYLQINGDQIKEELRIEDYAKAIVELFGSNELYINIFNNNKELLGSNSSVMTLPSKEMMNKFYDLYDKDDDIIDFQNIEHKEYIYVPRKMNFNNEMFYIILTKDISYIEKTKDGLMGVFYISGALGFIIISLITLMASKVLMKPLEKLNLATSRISQGDYGYRVSIESEDEVGELGSQFNKMAGEIENKIRELKIEGESKQRFIDNLAHELRTPLTSVIGYSDFLMRTQYNEENFYKSLNYINSEGKRVLNISKVLMDLTILREKELEIEEVKLEDVVSEVRDVLRVKIEEYAITLSVVGESFLVTANKNMVKLLITNLIDNAIKASNNGSIVEVGYYRKERVCLYVKDYGCGMSKEHIEKVLEPFYRVDKARARNAGGVGLGLTLCNEIVKKHDGDIEIESEEGEGTLIRVFF